MTVEAAISPKIARSETNHGSHGCIDQRFPSNMNEPNMDTPSSSPSSSMYARAIRMIKMAGGMLLKGKGVSNNKTHRSRIAIPITLLHKTKTSGQRG